MYSQHQRKMYNIFSSVSMSYLIVKKYECIIHFPDLYELKIIQLQGLLLCMTKVPAFLCLFYVATISQYINYCTSKWINLYFVLYHDIVRFEFAFFVIQSSKEYWNCYHTYSQIGVATFKWIKQHKNLKRVFLKAI